MRASPRDDRITVGTVWAVVIAAMLGFNALAVWSIIRFPDMRPIVPALIMAGAIAAMDRTKGEWRRGWAWAAVAAGLLACAAILLG